MIIIVLLYVPMCMCVQVKEIVLYQDKRMISTCTYFEAVFSVVSDVTDQALTSGIVREIIQYPFELVKRNLSTTRGKR